jgi:hypothetical protein
VTKPSRERRSARLQSPHEVDADLFFGTRKEFRGPKRSVGAEVLFLLAIDVNPVLACLLWQIPTVSALLVEAKTEVCLPRRVVGPSQRDLGRDLKRWSERLEIPTRYIRKILEVKDLPDGDASRVCDRLAADGLIVTTSEIFDEDTDNEFWHNTIDFDHLDHIILAFFGEKKRIAMACECVVLEYC